MDLDAQEQSHFQQHKLQLTNTCQEPSQSSEPTQQSSFPNTVAKLLCYCMCLCLLTDMVYRSCTEFSIELLGAKSTQVLNGERPKVEDIVAGKSISLLQQYHLGSQKSKLYSRAQPTRACSNNQTLQDNTQKGHLILCFSKNNIKYIRNVSCCDSHLWGKIHNLPLALFLIVRE